MFVYRIAKTNKSLRYYVLNSPTEEPLKFKYLQRFKLISSIRVNPEILSLLNEIFYFVLNIYTSVSPKETNS